MNGYENEMMSDNMNVKVGSVKSEGDVGKGGAGILNKNGQDYVNICTEAFSWQKFSRVSSSTSGYREMRSC